MDNKTHKRILSSNRIPDVIGITLLFLATGITIAITILQQQNYHEQHTSLARTATESLQNTIENELREKKWISRVFFVNNKQMTETLIEDPENKTLFHEIDEHLGRYFPDYYTFNIITDEGTLLVDDFDGMLDASCVTDINKFTETGDTSIRLHPHPKRFHFDVPVDIIHDEHHYTILVSFDFGRIASLIRESQPQQHKLLLVYKTMGNLIEATAFGSRNTLHDRDSYHMTRDEISRIMHEQAISGTSWHAIDIHAPHLFEEHNSVVRINSATLYATMLLVISIIWQALRRHNRHLEQRNSELTVENRVINNQNETLVRHSITDELTGIQNRRFFNDSSRLQWDMAQRSKTPVSLMMIDVDHFKLYNDTYGHIQGDKCLQQIASTMKNTYTRSVDIVARYGGEEFIIMTSDSNYQESLIQAEKLCESVEALEIQHANSETSDFTTISCGLVHATPGSKITLEELVARADNALYEAKKAGRNRVVAYDYANNEQIISKLVTTGGDSPASSSAAH